MIDPQMVTAFEAKDYNHLSANKLCNQNKNRSAEFVPLENYRVHLTPKPGTDGSDYINASWILGMQINFQLLLLCCKDNALQKHDGLSP